jgi:hypothetical protein
MKQSDVITKSELLKRGWDESKMGIYLGKGPYAKSEVIKTENYLTKIGIEWRVKE